MNMWPWLLTIGGVLLVLALLLGAAWMWLWKHSRPVIQRQGPEIASIDIDTQGQADPAASSPDLLALLQEAAQLEIQWQQDPQIIARLIEVYEQIIQRLDPVENPIFYPVIHNSLGLAYCKLPTGNHADNLRRAIACFRKALRVWTPDSKPSGYALAQNNMGLAYCDLFIDDAGNVESAIACYKEALRFRTPETTPLEYARTCGNLGIAYCRLPSGDRASNIQRGIECFLKALDFQKSKTTRIEYARTQTNLGAAYSMLPTNILADRKVNLAKAIACYQDALRFQSLKATPTDYDHTLHNLDLASHQLHYLDLSQRSDQPRRLTQKKPQGFKGEFRPLPCHVKDLFYEIELLVEQLQRDPQVAEPLISLCQQILSLVAPDKRQFSAFLQTLLGSAYYQRPKGNRTENLSNAIACYKKALEVFTLEDAPQDHALVENNLGTAYAELSYVKSSMDVRTEAITHFKQALRVWTPEAAPQDYALVQNNLGIIYSELPAGNPTESDPTTSLQQAIACYEDAVSLLTPLIAPLEYASIQVNLGNAYARLRAGKRAENFQRAKGCYEKALEIQTREAFPFEYARIKHNLGTVYRDLPEGDHEHNLLQAIACYEEALQILTGETYPFEYAQTQNSLGAIYANLSTGVRVTNLFRAIECYEKALTVFTPEKYPFHYAHTQNNLGHAYSNLSSGTRRENIARAIDCYRNALRFQTPETAPADCRKTSRNLADLYFTEGAWGPALSAYQTAMAAGKRLYEAGLFLESKAVEIAQNATLYHNAAFSAVCCGKKDEALRILENGKTQLLKEALRVRVPQPANVPDEDWSEFKRAQKEVRKNQPDEISQRSDRVRASLRTFMSRVQAAHAANTAAAAAIERVREHAPDFLEEMSVQAIQNMFFDETTALLTFCITNQGSFGFIVSQGNIQVVDIRKFTRADLRRLFVEWDADGEAVGGWLGAYSQFKELTSEASLVAWQAAITNTLAELGQRLLGPVLSELNRNVEQIILLPTAQLFIFPLHAVPLLDNDSKLVCDRYQVSYIPSIEVLSTIRAKIKQNVEPNLYAVVVPDVSDEIKKKQLKEKKLWLPKLVFPLIEGDAIAEHFADSTVEEGQDGTKQHVVDGVQGRTYVHFACHGSYNWGDPLASCLYLYDDPLTLAELQQEVLDLSAARLVTLSACETGIIDVVQGSADESVGLPAGFLLAGVPCVVSSLWSVDDFSTALLMEDFYTQLRAGQSIAGALKSAQCWLCSLTRDEVVAYMKSICDTVKARQQGGSQNSSLDELLLKRLEKLRGDLLKDYKPEEPPYAHPYYWAAFTATGM